MANELDPAIAPNLPSLVDRHADSRVGLTLRSAIASIPFVGGSLSILVEARLSARQTARIDALYGRIAELEEQWRLLPSQTNATTLPSEGLLEFATAAAASTVDQDRPYVFANILYLQEAGEDRAEILRRFLIEVCASITRYEVALLMRHGPKIESHQSSTFAAQLLTLHAQSPEIDEVREFSLDRLATFRLIDRSGTDIQLTAIGKQLLTVI